MPNEFIARNGVISRGNLVVSGSVISTSPASFSGSLSLTGDLNFQPSTSGASRFISMSALPTTSSGNSVIIQAGNATGQGTGGSIQLLPGFGAGGPGSGTVTISSAGSWQGATVNGVLTVTNSGPNTGTSLTLNGGGAVAMRWDWDNPNFTISAVTSAARILRFVGAAQYQVRGSGTTSSTTALLVQNANASSSLEIKDDRSVTVSGILTANSSSTIEGPLTVNFGGVVGGRSITANGNTIHNGGTGIYANGYAYGVMGNQTMVGNWSSQPNAAGVYGTGEIGVYGSGSIAGFSGPSAFFTVLTGDSRVSARSSTSLVQVRGSGTTSSTTALLVQNANATASFSVKDDGTTAVLSSNENPFTVTHTNGSSKFGIVLGNGSAIAAGQVALKINDSFNALTFDSGRIQVALPMTVGNATGQFRISGGGGGSDVVNGAIYLTDNTYNAGGYTATSGTQTTVQIGGFGAPSNLVWKPASGTANYTLLAIPPGISGSGTYSGTIRGIYYNPTVSSTTYGAHRAIETTAGDVVFSGGYVGIGRATNYGLEIANTSSLQESAYTSIPFGYATGSAAVSITPNIYATTGNRSFYSLYIGNPTITISGSFGNYDYRGLYVAGGSTLNGGIIAGDSRFFATSNAVSFQGYNPFNGQTGDAAGGITFTSRQVAGGDEAGIGAYYGGGSRLYLYNKYNASDSKIIFAVGGTTIRGAFFGTGNLSIGNGETDMSARLGVKGSGTTSSTTGLLVQNSSANTTFSVLDDGSIFFGTGSITYGPTSGPGAGLKISLVTGWGTAYPVSIGNLNTLGGYVVGGVNQGAGYGFVLGSNNTVNAGTGYILGSSNTQNTTNGTHIMIGGGHTSDAYTNNQNASIIIGQFNNTNGYYGGGLFGSQLKYYANNQLAFGGNSNNVDFGIREIYFGYGVRNEYTGANSGHGPNISINTSQAYSGSLALNRNGGSLSLRGGQGTGTGSAGDVIFATATTGSDGATYHSYSNRVWVKGHTGFVGIGTSSPSASLHVSGSTYLYKSGSTVLDIQGSQGQLFSVIDALSGSLMSVNDVSGLPILEVFSDDRVVMGTYGAPGLTVSGSLATVATGSSAPTGTAPEGTFRFAVVGGLYYIYAYIGGAWRSGSLT